MIIIMIMIMIMIMIIIIMWKLSRSFRRSMR